MFDDAKPARGQRLQQAMFYGCAVLLIAIVALVLYSVTMRYFFNAPPIWGEDVPRLLFVWLTFIGAGLATMLGLNIRVTFLIDKFPARLRLYTEVTMHVLVLVMLAVIFWYSLPVLRLNMNSVMLSTGWSRAWTYLALPTGCVVMAVYQTVLLVRTVKTGRRAIAEARAFRDVED
ncbi:MAG: TRAP transporter small permease subunit [Alphaproteobacteria bacterium]|jgi:TRAP-type C4-dicarboxylate transport system permease small subunit|nr:TRAP transporter small permease subunit [Alphaproteobacteria bacterium]